MKSRTLSPFLFTTEKDFQKNRSMFAMWINPSDVKVVWNTNFNEFYAKTGYDWFQWQNKLPVITFSGKSGWVAIQDSEENKLVQTSQDFITQTTSSVSGIINAVTGLNTSGIEGLFTGGVPQISVSLTDVLNQAKSLFNTDKTSANDPRTFIQNLQDVAIQDKFFFDTQKGYRRFNTKTLQVFTKKYPEGRKLQGYFNRFVISETGEDSQTISYSASFVVEKGFDFDEPDDVYALKSYIATDVDNFTTQTNRVLTSFKLPTIGTP